MSLSAARRAFAANWHSRLHGVKSILLDDRNFATDAATEPPPIQEPPRKKKRRRLLSDEPPLPPPSAFSSYSGGNTEHFKLTVVHQSTKSAARVCRIETPHGIIETPGYVPVATNAALKAVDIHQADAIGCQLMFANTYHLMLQPGAETIQEAGGIHKFTSRRPDRPFITDSGGFQVFSLAYGTVHEELNHSLKRSTTSTSRASSTRQGNLVLKISEEGVTFRSYRDGTRMTLSPETSIAAQKAIGADIILPLDELPPYHISEEALAASVARSHRWEGRSLLAHLQQPLQQACYGIIHGGSNMDLRRHSASYISSLPFDGLAVGGALGRDSDELFTIMQATMGWLRPHDHRPIHVLGIADPHNIPKLAQLGCDTFDSCHATRVGRHGGLLTDNGILRVVAAGNKSAHRPPVDGCACPTCSQHTLSYLHHLVKAKEPVAATLCSVHNISYMCTLMEKLRAAIMNDAV